MNQRDKTPTIIGSKELVDFPELGFVRVPAKIDTGADSSSIWASDIREQDGKLEFYLFDEQSPYYTGQKVSTDTYKVTNVRNSFGTTEQRYKVSLRAVIAGRIIRGQFTLANRSKNKYPVLLGRRTLNGKFIVDVSRSSGAIDIDMLVLDAREHVPETKQFFSDIASQVDQLRVTYATYNDLEFSYVGRTASITVLPANVDAASFDMVYFKTIGTDQYVSELAMATAQYLRQRGVRMIDTIMGSSPAQSKLYQHEAIQAAGLVSPASLLVPPAVLRDSFERFAKQFGTPFILKDIRSNKGKNNFLIHSSREFMQICDQAEHTGLRLIAQQYIDNDGDYRVLVFGKKIALVIYRTRTDKTTHLNNTSQGGRAELMPKTVLPESIRKKCIAVAKLLKREVAGVDVVQDKRTGLWYCLEVNDSPQLTTGAYVNEKQAAFAKFIEDTLRR